jgi:hypothetical protein
MGDWLSSSLSPLARDVKKVESLFLSVFFFRMNEPLPPPVPPLPRLLCRMGVELLSGRGLLDDDFDRELVELDCRIPRDDLAIVWRWLDCRLSKVVVVVVVVGFFRLLIDCSVTLFELVLLRVLDGGCDCALFFFCLFFCRSIKLNLFFFFPPSP